MAPLLATGSAATGTIQYCLFARIVAESAMQPGGASLTMKDRNAGMCFLKRSGKERSTCCGGSQRC